MIQIPIKIKRTSKISGWLMRPTLINGLPSLGVSLWKVLQGLEVYDYDLRMQAGTSSQDFMTVQSAKLAVQQYLCPILKRNQFLLCKQHIEAWPSGIRFCGQSQDYPFLLVIQQEDGNCVSWQAANVYFRLYWGWTNEIKLQMDILRQVRKIALKDLDECMWDFKGYTGISGGKSQEIDSTSRDNLYLYKTPLTKIQNATNKQGIKFYKYKKIDPESPARHWNDKNGISRSLISMKFLN